MTGVIRRILPRRTTGLQPPALHAKVKRMSRGSQPVSFFVKGGLALIVLLLATLMMAPGPAVNALRGFIILGLAITGVKGVLRHHTINRPPGRN
jgi:hypothetical protein